MKEHTVSGIPCAFKKLNNYYGLIIVESGELLSFNV